MAKCLNCGKECASHYRYCKDCYSVYYIGDCDLCHKAIYNDGKDDYVSLGKKDLYHLECYDKKQKLQKVKDEVFERKAKLYYEKNTILENEINSLRKDLVLLQENNIKLKCDNSDFENKLFEINNLNSDLLSKNNLLNDEYEKVLKSNNELLINIKNLSEEIEKNKDSLFVESLKLRIKELNSQVRKKVDRKYSHIVKCEDGHYTISREEKLIDDFFYHHDIKHIYEPKVYFFADVDEEYKPDWYLPDDDLYIEYCGVANSTSYDERVKIKIEKYKDYNLNCIFLFPEDIDNNLEKLNKEMFKGKITTRKKK